MKFIKCKLSELGEIVGGSTPSTKNKANYGGNISWITPKDLTNINGRYINYGERNITEVGYRSISAKMLPVNSVLFSSRAPIGYIAINNQKEVCTNQGFKSIIPNKKTDYMFLYYLLKYNKDKIENIGSGTIFKEVSGTVMKNIMVSIPENKENQIKIGSILSKIDDKIELNNQTNNNLLEFMNFKFNNWINALNNYTISALSNIATYTNGLAMQNFRPQNEKGLPVIKIKEMHEGLSDNTERCSSLIKKEYIVNNGDVLFAWSGTLCMAIWSQGKAGLNQHIFKVDSEVYPKWFYYLWTKKHLDKFIEIAAGKATTMGHIKRKELDSAEVKIPTKEELLKADKVFSPLLEKYIKNGIENETLKNIRDILLPKLMNGEIELDKVEI